MMGTSHAATGLLAGAGVAVLCQSDLLTTATCALVGGGAALLPDLDEPGSTVGRSLGRVTGLAAEGLREVSRRTYLRTATERELRAPKDGGHRHLTHTLPAALVFGAVAAAVMLVPLGAALLVFAMTALGLGTVLRSMRRWGRLRTRKRATVVVAGLLAAGTFLVEGSGPPAWLMGLTVFAGALTHILGDWLTKSGVPLAWPFTVRGKRWWMFTSPVAFHTGKSKVEVGIRWASLAGVPLVIALVPLPPVS